LFNGKNTEIVRSNIMIEVRTQLIYMYVWVFNDCYYLIYLKNQRNSSCVSII